MEPPPSYADATERKPNDPLPVLLSTNNLDQSILSLPPYSPPSNTVIQPAQIINTIENVEYQAPPPSYDSLFGRVQAAKEESTSRLEFCKRVFLIITGSVGCSILVGICLALPIAEIVIGGMYVNDCPGQTKLPVFLLAAGIATLLRIISFFLQSCCKSSENESQSDENRPNPFDQLINIFLFAWFIAGNVWVYGTHYSFAEGSHSYCHPTLYYFTYWLITSFYILIGAVCALLCMISYCCQFCRPNPQIGNDS